MHEAYLRLIDQGQVEWRDRAHFFGLASNLMRCILVDHYRTKHALKRGGDTFMVPIDEAGTMAVADWRENIVELDEAMNRLGAMDAQQARIVELRFFGGLSIEETAEVVGVSPLRSKTDGAWRGPGCTASCAVIKPRVSNSLATRRTDLLRGAGPRSAGAPGIRGRGLRRRPGAMQRSAVPAGRGGALQRIPFVSRI